MENYELRLLGVRDGSAVSGTGVHGREVAADAPLLAEALAQLRPHLLRVFPQPVRQVLGGARDGGPGVVPVASSVDVQISRALGQHLQRRSEVADRVAGYGGAEPDVLALHALVRGVQRRRRGDEDGPASRRVTDRAPNVGRSPSICAGVEPSPSTSASTMGFQASGRYCSSSLPTVDTSSGTEPAMMSGPASPEAHSACTTALISRRTPRVRWKRSSVDQSS